MNTNQGTDARAGVVASFASIYLIWGTTYLAIAFVIRTIPPFIAGGIRYGVGALLLYAWLRWRSREPLRGVPIVAAMLCGVFLSGIGNGFVIWAQQGVPSGVAALIVAATPVVVSLFDWAWFSRKVPNTRALLGIAVGLAGVVTIVTHTHDLTSGAQPLHLAAMFAAVVGWSFGTLQQKRLANSETVLSFTCVQMFGGGVFQFAMATFDREWPQLDVTQISLASAVALGYLIVFGSIIALSAYLWLLTRVPSQKVTTYALVNPIVALILGAVVLHERITFVAVVAASLVLIGVALVMFPQRSKPKLPPRRSESATACARTS
ncbi:MAG: EamA family transporter [Steroidobacteraceae bacterium]